MVSVATSLDRYLPTRRQMASWAEREPDLAGVGFDELRAARAREDGWAVRTTDLDVPVGEPAAEGDVDVRLLLRQAVDAGVISPAVAELIELTRIHCVPLAAVSERTGVSYEALKKRRQRGEAAVAAWLNGERRRWAA